MCVFVLIPRTVEKWSAKPTKEQQTQLRNLYILPHMLPTYLPNFLHLFSLHYLQKFRVFISFRTRISDSFQSRAYTHQTL